MKSTFPHRDHHLRGRRELDRLRHRSGRLHDRHQPRRAHAPTRAHRLRRRTLPRHAGPESQRGIGNKQTMWRGRPRPRKQSQPNCQPAHPGLRRNRYRHRRPRRRSRRQEAKSLWPAPIRCSASPTFPQIATFADHHYVIEKKAIPGRTRTSIRPITGNERTEEVARMLSGAKLTDTSRKHAEQMIKANG